MDLSLSGVKDPGGHCLFSRTLQFGNDRMLGFCLEISSSCCVEITASFVVWTLSWLTGC